MEAFRRRVVPIRSSVGNAIVRFLHGLSASSRGIPVAISRIVVRVSIRDENHKTNCDFVIDDWETIDSRWSATSTRLFSGFSGLV
eukprot:COSAG02_NODE_16013_length_1121_cov_1.023483_2_plen_85_part_00